MFTELKDKYKNNLEGKTIAILASGPSVDLFTRQQDFTIGVNGASKLLQQGDFFVSSEEATYREPWFKSCPKNVINIVRACAAIYSSKFYPNNTLRTNLIQAFEKFLDDNKDKVITRWDGIKEIIPEHLQNEFDQYLPQPAQPHILMRNVKSFSDGNTLISPKQKEIIIGGTVSCVATQIAYHLGAKEIHLYGVQFTNEQSMKNQPGHTYSSKLDPCGGGFTTEGQRQVFQNVIQQIQTLGIPIISHGYTRLENTLKLSS